MGEAVGLADDEVVEAVLGVQPGVVRPFRRCTLEDRLWGGRGFDVGLALDRFLCRAQGLLLELGVDHDVERGHGDGIAELAHRGEQRHPHPHVKHAGGEFVRHFEVEGAGRDALGFHQVQEAVQHGSDGVIGLQQSQNRPPCFADGLFPVWHGSPQS